MNSASNVHMEGCSAKPGRSATRNARTKTDVGVSHAGARVSVRVNDGCAVLLDGVSKTLRGRSVLRDVSLSVPAGRVYGFYGPNGSGKTMMLRAIAGIVRIDTGSVWVDGACIGHDVSFAPATGVLIERCEMWNGMTGRKNLELLASIGKKVDRAGIDRALHKVGLDPEDKRHYGKFSLGMKQRLALAQAIMEQPELLLLDEPSNALDEEGQNMVKNLICAERERGATVLVVSHDRNLLDTVCDRQFTVADGTVKEAADR